MHKTALRIVYTYKHSIQITCSYPEGQDVASETKCAEYTACEWTDGRCHMVSNDVGGYVVDGEAQDTGRGFKVFLLFFSFLVNLDIIPFFVLTHGFLLVIQIQYLLFPFPCSLSFSNP